MTEIEIITDKIRDDIRNYYGLLVSEQKSPFHHHVQLFYTDEKICKDCAEKNKSLVTFSFNISSAIEYIERKTGHKSEGHFPQYGGKEAAVIVYFSKEQVLEPETEDPSDDETAAVNPYDKNNHIFSQLARGD